MKSIYHIPSRLAPALGVDKALISRWNNGKRRLPDDMAMKIVDLLEAEGEHIDILALKPQHKRLVLYFCRNCRAKRKLRKESPGKAGCPAE